MQRHPRRGCPSHPHGRGAVFAAHLGYVHIRLGHSPHAIAVHAAAAVALGAFLLAAAATTRAARVPSHAPYWRYLLAPVLWPAITAPPAFLVALGVGAVWARLPRRAWTNVLSVWFRCRIGGDAPSRPVRR